MAKYSGFPDIMQKYISDFSRQPENMDDLPDNACSEKANLDGQLTRQSWKVFQIMAEFVEGFEHLAPIWPSVSIFGSARTARDDPNYQKAPDEQHFLAGFDGLVPEHLVRGGYHQS